jgi:hypothetical protein
VVALGGREVVKQARIYETICELHAENGHGGRDKTFKELKARYSFVPKGAFLPSCCSNGALY